MISTFHHESLLLASGDHFLNDTLDLFRGVRAGHMNPYAFNEPDLNISNDPVRGGEYWHDFIASNADYYLVRSEADCIQNYAYEVAGILPENLMAVEFGPGETKAITTKTLPFIRAIKAKEFVAVDVNSVYAHEAASFVANEGIQSHASVADFFHDDLCLPDHQKVVSLFGGLMCNIPSIKGVHPLQVLRSVFSIIRPHFNKGDYFVITQDACNDPEKLKAAYDHPLIGKYILSILHKIKRDLHTVNFDPSAFQYAMRYDDKMQCVILGCVTDKPQSFQIEGEAFTVPAGRVVSLVNSYKFGHPSFVNAIRDAGFLPLQTYNCGDDAYMHILRAL